MSVNGRSRILVDSTIYHIAKVSDRPCVAHQNRFRGWMPDDIWVTWSVDGKSAYDYHDDKITALPD